MVHGTLYNYGLTFSTAWAEPYWLVFRISIVLIIVAISVISVGELRTHREILCRVRKVVPLTGNRLRQVLGKTAKSLHRSRKTALLMLAVATITIIVNAEAAIWLSGSHGLLVPSIGTLQTLDVEAYGGDVTLKDEMAYIEWGAISVGTVKNNTFYLRSASNVNIKLNLEVANWDPPDMASYMNLTWNYSGRLLRPGEAVPITLTLKVSSSDSFINYVITNDVSEFSFDVRIYASKW